ncbi:MAG: hypothetical protein F6K28_59700 [Microcoleus sp. SIO2G3]|nr:hypothetical protein [Microcoleus sp. SIO2G3]
MLKTRFLPTFMLTLSALAIAPFILPAIAHQAQHQATSSTEGGMEVMIHLDPNDSPVAGSSSETWFVLTAPSGDNVPLANCNCEAMVYDANEQMVVHNLPLGATMVDDKEAIGTAITFPAPGSYTVVLSGQSQDGSFEPFEIRFPVTAVTSTSMY